METKNVTLKQIKYSNLSVPLKIAVIGGIIGFIYGMFVLSMIILGYIAS